MASNALGHQLVVCDAGPIIHLDEMDCLFLISDFARVLIPDAVWNEVKHHRPQALKHCKEIMEKVAPTQPLTPNMKASIQLFSLHAGEIQALNIAQEYQADLLLTDDTAARLAAKSMQISVHGTLGILLRSIRRKQQTPEEVLAILHSLPDKSTLHLRASLLQEVIEQVEKFLAR